MIPVSPEKLLEVGIALSAEKDGDILLETILTAAMDITECDAGTLYILSDNALAFRTMITKSMNVFRGGRRGAIGLPPVQLSRSNVCSRAAIDGELINIADVYESSDFDFSGPRKYDAMTGYRTQSMLVVPMENDRGDVIGVLQLLNAQDSAGNTVPFDAYYERVIRSLAAQAAICLANMNYAREIIELLDSFVRVMSTAIDARTPYNANHTRNMVLYGERFIDWLNAGDGDWRFGDAQKRQFLMSVWLHDVGKLVTPLEIMDKDSRLGSRLSEVLHRFECIELRGRVAYLEGRTSEKEYQALTADVKAAQELVQKANAAGFLSDDMLASVWALSEKTYDGPDGATYLTPEETVCLSVRKGTLTDAERAIMEGHVTMTARMLDEMKFSRDYLKVPEWASEHHEYLDGSGYPKKLTASELPREVRLLSILDIFDALTARDRPYKQPMPAERAFAILDSMAADGQLDGDILEQFKKSDAWEERK